MRETFDLEVRFSSVADDGTVEAVAVPFNTVDSYGTSFDQRAFGTITKRVPMLWSHDPSQVIGSWMEFEASDKALRAKGKLNLEIERAREVRAMLQAEDIRGISPGFRVLKAEPRAGGITHFTKVELVELSLVAMASIPGAKVTKIRARPHGAAAADFITAIKSAARAFNS